MLSYVLVSSPSRKKLDVVLRVPTVVGVVDLLIGMDASAAARAIVSVRDGNDVVMVDSCVWDMCGYSATMRAANPAMGAASFGVNVLGGVSRTSWLNCVILSLKRAVRVGAVPRGSAAAAAGGGFSAMTWSMIWLM